jgi:serine/threonine protein kinase
MSDSADSILSKLTVSQTIPEGQIADYTVTSPIPIDGSANSISRDSSMRSSRRRNIPGSTSRRSSRRSTSANQSSPAQQFLNSFGRSNGNVEQVSDTKPDDEGQEFGIDDEKYIIGEKINQGGFGVIKKAHSITEHGTRITCAVKILRKQIPEKDASENEKAQVELEHELSVWRHLNHRHILRLRAVFETDFATFCLMDLNEGGTLHDVVKRARKSSITINEGRRGIGAKLARHYAFQLACALRYLHQDVRVCHRDVKMENCLIDMSVPNAETEGGLLRLCDFGLADFLDNDSAILDEPEDRPLENPTSTSVIGTLEYASPRGLSADRKLFETPGDVWAFGVIVYALCTGDYPFKEGMPSQTIHKIMREPWPENALRQAAEGGEAVVDLVKGCLEKSVEERITIVDALLSPWFEGCEEEPDPNLFA